VTLAQRALPLTQTTICSKSTLASRRRPSRPVGRAALPARDQPAAERLAVTSPFARWRRQQARSRYHHVRLSWLNPRIDGPIEAALDDTADACSLAEYRSAAIGASPADGPRAQAAAGVEQLAAALALGDGGKALPPVRRSQLFMQIARNNLALRQHVSTTR
jgi:hypothetical protein